MSKQYTVTLGQITTSSGIVCSNPNITFEKPSCANIVCELLKDGNGNVTSIKVQVPNDCPDGCVDVKIDCTNACDTCGIQRLRICPCEVDSDCPSCSKCGTNGYCITECNPGEFCSGDRCVECDEFTPCTGGKVCESGKCKCPPNRPYLNQKGECVECNQDTPLSPCQVCDNGIIKGKNCPEGVLNPNTCECVECVKSSDCKKPNEKCGPNGCECEDGFIRNPATGDCEPSPDCVRDEDCGNCRKCKENGKCGDYECPPGYTPSNTPGECCVKLCDCSNPSCPPGYKCINLDGTKCFCQNCNLKCNNGKCPEGCLCGNNSNCHPNPCGGKCDPNNPCPNGCGCDENGDCIPCSSLNCADCEKVSGCECATPDNCISSDCKGKCDESNPCPTGCGCNSSKECVNCRKVTCTKNSDCPEGCDCAEDHKCQAKPCDNVYCNTPADCGKDCNCIKGECQKGTRNPGDDNCNDKFDIIDPKDCTLKGELSTIECCECRKIFAHNEHLVSAGSRTVNTKLRIGANISDQLLSGTGISGDSSISGQLRYSWDQIAKEIDGSGNVIANGGVTNLNATAITVFSNTDTSTVDALVKANGQIIVSGGKNCKIVETTVYVESIGLLTNNISACTYNLGKSIIYRTSLNDAGTSINKVVELNKVQRCKNPIFTWFKSNDGQNWTQFKKVYSKSNLNKFYDIIKKEDGLVLCKYYKLSSDCGCVKDVYYSCSGGNLTKYDPNLPKDLIIKQLDACGKGIKIEEVTLCNLYDGTIPPFKLYINGVFEADILPDSDNKIFTGGVTYTKTLPITEVKLVYPCDGCNNPLIKKMPNLGFDCSVCADAGMGGSFSFNCISGINASGTVQTLSGPTAIPGCKLDFYVNDVFVLNAITDVSGQYDVYLPIAGNGIYKVKIINCFGCELISNVTVSGCCAASLNGISYNCSTKTITSNIAGCTTPGNYTLKQMWDGLIASTGAYSNSIVLSSHARNGEYELSVDCGGGCTAKQNFNVDCGQPIYNKVATCDGLDGKITISSISGGQPPYTIQISDTDTFGTILASGSSDPFTWTVPQTNKTYWIRVIELSGNSFITNIFVPDCSQNSYTYTTIMKCIAGVQKFCFTPSITGYFTALVKDVSNNTVYTGSIYATAGQETCTNFSALPDNGVGSISLTYNGNTIVKSLNIVSCSVATIDYDCTTGLTVSGVTSFTVHSTGYPSGGYGPYSNTETNLFFTDGPTDTRVLTIKSADSSETYGSITINCCTTSFTVENDMCNGTNAKIKIILNAIAGNYKATIFSGSSQVCTPQNIVHPGGTATYSLTCNLASSTNYGVIVENSDYGTRGYRDGSLGNVTCDVTNYITTTNCGNTGGGGGTGCPITESDFVITGGCTPSVTNNSSYIVNAIWKSTENTNCTGAEFVEGGSRTINPGQTVPFATLGHVNLGKKLIVSYTGVNGDACVLSICYTGCTGGSTCTLTDPPSATCSTAGAAPGNRRLTVTNTNANAVFVEIDGVSKGMVAAGGNLITYYPNNTTHTILFKCVDDILETISITYLLNC